MALLGFVLYTSSYSVIYAMKTSGKPVAVTEMWMVLTHLVCSVLSCVIVALTVDFKGQGSNLAKAQSAVFLGVALAATGLGTACLQDGLYCSMYYPAAAFPPLSAAGTMAWAWVMYVASLGCQTGVISLGSEAIATACIVGHVVPQILSALDSTCGGKWKGHCSSGIACSTALNATVFIAALLLSHVGNYFLKDSKSPMVGAALQVLAVAMVWINILLSPAMGHGGAMGIYLWTMGLLTLFPLYEIVIRIINQSSRDKFRGTNNRHVHPTGIRFPPLHAGANAHGFFPLR